MSKKPENIFFQVYKEAAAKYNIDHSRLFKKFEESQSY